MAQGHFKTFEREVTRTPKLNVLYDQVQGMQGLDPIADTGDANIDAILAALRRAGILRTE